MEASSLHFPKEIVAKMIFVFVILIAKASFARPDQPREFNFATNEEGHWVLVTKGDLAEFIDTSKVVCFSNASEIKFEWNSESGDWVIFDTYRSSGTFFTRTIRFAASDNIIQMTKQRRNSKEVVRIGGDDIAQYDFLLATHRVITQQRQFPYHLPSCASRVFTRQ